MPYYSQGEEGDKTQVYFKVLTTKSHFSSLPSNAISSAYYLASKAIWQSL